MDNWKLEILGAIIASIPVIWGAFKGTKMYRKHVNGIKAKIAGYVVQGVMYSADNYVMQKKAENQGKLPIDHQVAARSIAAGIAKAMAASEAPEVIKRMTDKYLFEIIEETLTRMKEAKQ